MVLAGTPLGNIADASQRLQDLLAEADVIAAEDTRRLRRLAADFGIVLEAQVISYYEAVEIQRAHELVQRAAAGELVLVVTDAGMPTVSDPGYRIVVAAHEAGVPVDVAPGPSAVTTALAVSGLPSDRFCFEGFLPRKPGELRKRLQSLADEQRTMVFFESPKRVAKTLDEMCSAWGADRPAVVCRELTKTYEEIVRSNLGELREWALSKEMLGEFTLVVAGAPDVHISYTSAQLAGLVADQEAAGTDRKSAIAAVAQQAGIPKRQVYAAVLEHK